MKTQRQNGFSLPYCLFLSVIIGLLMVNVQQSIDRHSLVVGSTYTNLTKKILSDNDSHLTLARVNNGHIDPKTLNLKQTSLTNLTSLKSSTSDLTRLLRISKNPDLPQPDWKKLKREAVLFLCEKDNYPAKTLSESLRSGYACKDTELNNLPLSYIEGNLIQNSKYELARLTNKTQRIVVRGEVALLSGVTLSNSSNAAIEILALGDIHISSIDIEKCSECSLLIYSASGIVEIAKSPESLVDCPRLPSNKMQLISPKKISINNKTYSNTITIGCPTSKDQKYWPTAIELGTFIE